MSLSCCKFSNSFFQPSLRDTFVSHSKQRCDFMLPWETADAERCFKSGWSLPVCLIKDNSLFIPFCLASVPPPFAFSQIYISHSQEAERQGIGDKSELGIFEIRSFRRHRGGEKSPTKTPCSKSCPNDVYTEGNRGGNTIQLRRWNAHWDSAVEQDTQCEPAHSTTTSTTNSCEKLAPGAAFHWQQCTDAAFCSFLIGTHKGEMMEHTTMAIPLVNETEALWSPLAPQLHEKFTHWLIDNWLL